MITHQIDKYELPRALPPPSYSYPQKTQAFDDDRFPRTVNVHSAKWVYARWIEQMKLRLKVGEYVVHQVNVHNWAQRKAEHYHRVASWQELQQFCRFDQAGRPLALELVDREGTRSYVCGEDWRYVGSPQEHFQFSMPAA